MGQPGWARLPHPAKSRAGTVTGMPPPGFEPGKACAHTGLDRAPLTAWVWRRWVRTESNSHLLLWKQASSRWTTHPQNSQQRTEHQSHSDTQLQCESVSSENHNGETESRTPKPRGSRFRTERSHLSACLTTRQQSKLCRAPLRSAWRDAATRIRTGDSPGGNSP
jgi:hypothetical protein